MITHQHILNGNYLFALDCLFEHLVSNQGDYDTTFKETEIGIKLEIWDKESKTLRYSHETPYKEKRKCIEQFIIDMVAKGLEYNEV